jgi:hypothetical protein
MISISQLDLAAPRLSTGSITHSKTTYTMNKRTKIERLPMRRYHCLVRWFF